MHVHFIIKPKKTDTEIHNINILKSVINIAPPPPPTHTHTQGCACTQMHTHKFQAQELSLKIIADITEKQWGTREVGRTGPHIQKVGGGREGV